MSIAWSFSLLTAFETCPRRFKLTRLTEAVVEPQTEALTHGNEVHKALELAVSGARVLPEKYKQYLPIVNMARATPGNIHTELKFGLDKNLQPTEFFSPTVWCRGVLDYAAVRTRTAVVLDWKTGKPKPDTDQLELFAAAAFSLFPNIETVRTGYAWLQHNKIDSQTFERQDADAVWKQFKSRVIRMELAATTNNYPPIPGGLCRNYCPVPSNLCEFSGKQ